MSETMLATWFEQTGDAADVLKTGERDRPAAAAGEVRVRLHASGVNPSDVKKRAGAQPPGFVDGHVIPHSDGAGVVDAVGDGVDDIEPGQRVWVFQAQFQRHQGTCAQYVSLPRSLVAPLPDNAGFEIGACLGIPAMTAHRCVFNRGEVGGQTLLVTGASGRVGYYAAQWARHAGATVIATAGSEARCAIAAATGADHVLDYTREDFADTILSLTNGEGVDKVIDVEFGLNAATSAEVLKVNGSIATYSSSKAPTPEIPFYPLMFKNISLDMVLVYNMPDAAKEAAKTDIHDALAAGWLKHRVAEIWPLEETARAHESIEAGGRDGCVIVEIK